MEKFLHFILDDSFIEYFLTKNLIFDGMNECDKKIIEFIIESDKEIKFMNIKTMLINSFIIEFGYFTDNVDNKYLLKILSASFSFYTRPRITKIARKYEKKGLINVGKRLFKIFNGKLENTILKHIVTNNSDDIDNMKSIYLESYNYILFAYEQYIITIIALMKNVSILILYVFFYPLLYKLKYGLVRNTFNTIFSVIYNVFVTKLFEETKISKIKKNIIKNKIKNEHECSSRTLINAIISLFDNINIIVENNTLKHELTNIVKQFQNVVTESDFLNKYRVTKFQDSYIKSMQKYKIVDTIVSIIINDQNMLLFLEVGKSSIIQYLDVKLDLYKRIQNIRIIFDIINKKTYRISNTIPWSNNENIVYIFTLHDIVLNYKNNDELMKNININFEIGKIHFFFGNSGCGKTTLLNVLMRKINTNHGTIKFLGIHENYDYFSIREYLSYISCESALFYNNLYFNIVYGIPKEKILKNKNEIKNEIIKYMTIFGLKNFIPVMKTKNALNLSKGQKQRVVIIRLVIHIIFNNLRILFLDEFTSNIDNIMEITIFNQLLHLHKIYPFTMFYVSHNYFNIKYSDFNYKFNVEERRIIKSPTTSDASDLYQY